MSEEEKKAIEYTQNNIESYVYLLKNDVDKKEYYSKAYPNMEAERILLNLIEKQQKEIEEIRQWKYVIDTYEDSDKLKELDLIKIKGKKYIAENRLQEFKDLLLKELDRDFVTEEYRQGISCYFKKLLEE